MCMIFPALGMYISMYAQAHNYVGLYIYFCIIIFSVTMQHFDDENVLKATGNQYSQSLECENISVIQRRLTLRNDAYTTIKRKCISTLFENIF